VIVPDDPQPPPPPPPAESDMSPDTSADLPVRDMLFIDEPTPLEAFLRSVEDGDVPLFGIWNRVVPLYAPHHLPTWALLNLILSALGLIYAAVALIYVVFRRKHDGDEQELEGEPYTTVRKKGLLIAAVMAVMGALLFVLTQDMENIMIMIDWWTIIHLVIFFIEIVAIVYMVKRNRDDGGDAEKENRHVSDLKLPMGRYGPQPLVANPAVNDSS